MSEDKEQENQENEYSLGKIARELTQRIDQIFLYVLERHGLKIREKIQSLRQNIDQLFQEFDNDECYLQLIAKYQNIKQLVDQYQNIKQLKAEYFAKLSEILNDDNDNF